MHHTEEPAESHVEGRPARSDAASLLSELRVEIATVFGVGHIRFAPGTFGSAAALPLAFVLAPLGPALYLTATVLIIVIAIWSADAATRQFGLKDPGPVVIDEVAGQLVALAFVPMTVLGILGGFFLFRFFDIVKPFPANRLEALPGGVGIVLDDLAAGLYANLLVHAGLRVLDHLSA